MSRQSPFRASGLALLLAFGLVQPAQAQDLFGRLLDRARDRVEREAERQIDRAMRPGEPQGRPEQRGATRSTPVAATGGAASARLGVAGGPSATAVVSSAPQNLWLRVGSGRKFEPIAGTPQIISTNPYLSPPDFLFATLRGMACAPDGSVIVSGEGWENGDFGGVGWWRIAADGAVTPIFTHAPGSATALPLPYNISVARNGGVLTASRDAIHRVRDGVGERLAGPDDGTSGYRDGSADEALFDRPGVPVEDDQGHIWVVDQNNCVLRRIAPGGPVTTVIDRDRSTCGGNHEGDYMPLASIAWDATNGELIVVGSANSGRNTSDLRVTIWRVRRDGTARRVYNALKVGGGPAGQTMDHISAVTVEPSGAIVVASKDMNLDARRQILRLDEPTGRLVSLTGQAFRSDHARPGSGEDPQDGPAARAHFRKINALCRAPDGTIFALDEHLVRRLNTDGTVRTWAY